MADPIKWFPIQDGPAVPWSYMAPHEVMAKKNHGQTLDRLAERGGLGSAEAELIVTAQPLYPKSGGWDWADLKKRWVERAERVNNAFLALPPADDDEPLTDAWLNGVSGDGWSHRGHTVEIGPLEFEPHAHEAGGPVTLHPEKLHVKRLAARGDVRRLCAALGIQLKEPKS